MIAMLAVVSLQLMHEKDLSELYSELQIRGGIEENSKIVSAPDKQG